MNNIGDLTAFDPPATPGVAGLSVPIGIIPATGSNGYSQGELWYRNTAGVVVLPLTPMQLQWISNAPLMISGNADVSISKWHSGAFLRADRFVYCLSPGDRADIPVYAM